MLPLGIFESILEEYRHIPPENFNHEKFAQVKQKIIQQYQLEDPTVYRLFVGQSLVRLEEEQKQTGDPLAKRFIEHLKIDGEAYLRREELDTDTSSVGTLASYTLGDQRMKIPGSTVRHMLTPDTDAHPGAQQDRLGHRRELEKNYFLGHGRTVFASQIARTLNKQPMPIGELNKKGREALRKEREQVVRGTSSRQGNPSKSVEFYSDPSKDATFKVVSHADGILTNLIPCSKIKKKFMTKKDEVGTGADVT